MHLFTYGSLMYPPVWNRVVAGRYACCPATLAGYRRLQVRGEAYPALWPGEPGDRVTGVLYFDLQPADLGRLDRFEGEQYEHLRVICQTDAGPQEALAYGFRAHCRALLGTADWDPAWFEREGLKAFIRRYRHDL